MHRTMAADLGRVAHLILEAAARRPAFTFAGFARHLGCDGSMLTLWKDGKRPMPVEVLPILAEYLGDPEVVYGDLLARSRARLVVESDVPPREPREVMVEVVPAIGALLVAWGAGEVEVTAEQAVKLRQVLRDLLDLLEELDRSLTSRFSCRSGA